MSTPPTFTAGDPAVLRARNAENVVVGHEIVRHRLASRVIHWAVAVSFFIALFSGFPIWTPVLGWMASLFGGLHVCRWLHPWAGVAFSICLLVMFAHWFGEMRLEPKDREWLQPRRVLAYMKHEGDDADVGKYNGGQKLFFFAVALGTLGLLVSGVVLWLPGSFPRIVSEAAVLLHDLTFILFVVAVILHIYLGTAAEPGTFRSMTRGSVTRPWASLNHPRWYREVVDEQPPAR